MLTKSINLDDKSLEINQTTKKAQTKHFKSSIFSVGTGNDYSITHNFGTKHVDVTVIFSTDAAQTANIEIIKGVGNSGSGFTGFTIRNIADNSFDIRTANASVILRMDGTGNYVGHLTSGYYQVIVTPLY